MWRGPALVVFDLAGTTVEDRGLVSAAFVAALAEHGLNVSAAKLLDVRGASKREAILRLVPEGPDRAQRVEAAYGSFQQHLARRFAADGVRPVPGAEETFAWLRV